MAALEPLTKELISDAQHTVNRAYDLLNYLAKDDNGGPERVLAECVQAMLDEAGNILDRPFRQGGAS